MHTESWERIGNDRHRWQISITDNDPFPPIIANHDHDAPVPTDYHHVNSLWGSNHEDSHLMSPKKNNGKSPQGPKHLACHDKPSRNQDRDFQRFSAINPRLIYVNACLKPGPFHSTRLPDHNGNSDDFQSLPGGLQRQPRQLFLKKSQKKVLNHSLYAARLCNLM
jgi:hypothetical protein